LLSKRGFVLLMKKIILHIVLLSYAVVLIKPVLPYVSDFIQHTFFYASHMATVHYENGKYHVHYQTAKEAAEEKQDKSNLPTQKKQTTTTEDVVITDKQVLPFIAAVNLSYNITAAPCTSNGVSNLNYPPPRF
jgi:hypothetical protein